MKTKLVHLLTISIISLSLFACSGGSINSGPGTTPLPVVVPIDTPAGIPINPQAPAGFNNNYNQIALLNNNSFQTFQLPESMQQSLLASPPTQVISNVNSTIVIAESLIWMLTIKQPDPISGSDQPNLNIINYAIPNSVRITTPRDVQPDFNGLTQPDVVFGGYKDNQPGIIFLSTSGQATLHPLSNCPSNVSYGDPSTVHVNGYDHASYAGIGTSSGVVCVLTRDTLQPYYTNISQQAPSRYQGGTIDAFSFSSLGQSLWGYWQLGNTIWRVTAQYVNHSTQPIPNSFWEVTNSNPQISSSGTTTIQFYNVPPAVNSMVSDINNNLYVGTNDGFVYKLASTANTWSKVQITDQAVSIFLSPTQDNQGVVATAVINGQTQVYNIN